MDLKLLPKLILAHEVNGHETLGVHLEIEQKPDLLEHLPVQEVRLIHDDNWLQMVNAMDQFVFPVSLAIDIALGLLN